MISELRISHLGVIAAAEVELAPGFTVVTGETGAGKTMFVSALSLLMGEKVGAGVVRTSASPAKVARHDIEPFGSSWRAGLQKRSRHPSRIEF